MEPQKSSANPSSADDEAKKTDTSEEVSNTENAAESTDNMDSSSTDDSTSSDMNKGDSQAETADTDDAMKDAPAEDDAPKPDMGDADAPNDAEGPSDAKPSETPAAEGPKPFTFDSAASATPETPSTSSPADSASPAPFDAPAAAAAASSVFDTPPAPVTGMAPKSRKKGMIIGAIVGAVVVVLLGASAAAYTMVMNKPENVLKRAIANSFDGDKVKTVHFSGALDVTDKSSADPMTFSATFTGASDASKGAFDFSSKFDVFVANLTLDMRSADGKTLYVKLGGLEGVPQILSATGDPQAVTLYAPLIKAVNNQWFEINQSMIKQLTGKESGDIKLSDADMKKLGEAYEKNQFLVIKQKYANEKIASQDSYHYKIGIDEGKLKQFAAAVKAANIPAFKMTQDDLNNFNKAVDDADFAKYPFDIWIAKKTKLVDQVQLKINEGSADMTMRVTIDSYNKPVNVEVPKNAKSLLDVIGTFYSSYMQSTGTSTGSSLMEDINNSGISL